MAGYEVTLSDFRALLTDRHWRDETARWLSDHGLAGRTDVVALHAEIQADPELQGSLYRMAMTLWR